MLVHVTVQDATSAGGRGVVVDLIDNQPPVMCSDTMPCVSQFNENFNTPDVSCSATMPGQVGTCNDPLKVTSAGVPLFVGYSTPAKGDAGSGQQIRIVFNKILDNTIETVMPSGSTTPGATNVYALVPTVAKLVDPMGMEVMSQKFYDNGGAPTFSSDLILAPLGPAIVIKPASSLSPGTTYSIVLDTTAIKDRTGQAPVDQSGAALPNPYKLNFTTEGIVPNPGSSFPDFTMPAKITPNEVLQFSYFTTFDPAKTVVTITGPGSPIMTEVYSDNGALDPKSTKPPSKQCAANNNPNQLDIVRVSAPGMPVDWAPGDYTLSFTVQSDLNPMVNYTSPTYKFTVAGTDEMDPTKDPNIFSQHLLPEQCTP